ncbi:MAG: DUF190 domain-containing protein [Terriglobales bacterium]
MTPLRPAQMVRLHFGENDLYAGRPLYEAVVAACRDEGIAGVTVYRGIEGFGASTLLHRPSLFGRSADAPIVVTLVDVEEKVQHLLPHLKALFDGSLDGGLIAISEVEMLRLGHA